MPHLTRSDYQLALRAVAEVAADANDLRAFASRGNDGLRRLVPAELVTLSVCDLRRATRSVVSTPASALSEDDRARFDRFFATHPLVRYHSANPAGGPRKISDALTWTRFRESALYAEYYRRIGIDHAIAVPLFVDRAMLVSFVLNRRQHDFDERDREVLDLVRAPLARIYRQLARIEALEARVAALTRTGQGDAGEVAAAARAVASGPSAAIAFAALPISPREREVLRWLAAGKTDRQIAAILGTSPRTVQKHLEHLYVKLGVETRTAAVVRALALVTRSGM